MPPEAELLQGIHPRISDKEDTASVAAVSTIRPAAGYVLLVSETDGSGPAISAPYLDSCRIYEFHVPASGSGPSDCRAPAFN